MAAALGTEALRRILRDEPSGIASRGFAVLKGIATLLNEDTTSVVGRELLLRALDHRRSFEPHLDILDSLSRQAGLFPYVDPATLSFQNHLAYEFHRPAGMGDDLVFHREQAEIYQALLAGNNVILSAPTSFGKSKLIDAMVATGRFDNIAVIVPTLALIDETRRRLSSLRTKYKIVSHLAQQPSKRNIFVLTPERAIAFSALPRIDFFAVDEFYKLDSAEEDETRTIALNHAFYRLLKGGGQFYLLGPNIRQIPQGLEEAFRCTFYPSSFSTVVIEQHRVNPGSDKLEKLTELARELKEPTLIFCSSPPAVATVANTLLDAGVGDLLPSLDRAAEWTSRHYHPDWIFGRALRRGIGVHHGRLPRSLAQYAVRAFNDGNLRFLVCTSTLIEGVNTRAKNVIMFDHSIARRKIDYFTFNNIKGRSGRMGHHFVGHVFLFADPPQEELPFVDFPLFTQGSETPEALLIQMDPADLSQPSQERVNPYLDESVLPLAILKENEGIAPALQIALARRIAAAGSTSWRWLAWRGWPKYEELKYACELIWETLVSKIRQHGVYSGKQLAHKTWQLWNTPSAAKRIVDELRPGRYAPASVDEAVDRVLQFERNWAGFELPRLLMALHRIQYHVLTQRGLPAGDYSQFAARLESQFRPAVVSALDEYGIPVQLAERIHVHLRATDDLDVALQHLAALDPRKLGLSQFEQELVQNARDSL